MIDAMNQGDSNMSNSRGEVLGESEYKSEEIIAVSSLHNNPTKKKKRNKKNKDSENFTSTIESTALRSNKSLPEADLDTIIIKSELLNLDPEELTDNILIKYNRHISTSSSCFVTSAVRGDQIPPGEFMLGIYNNRPELAGPGSKPKARRLIPTPGRFTKILAKQIKQSAAFYGDCGVYVLNVPAGAYAKAKSGNKFLLYGEGCHVIHDANFRFDPTKDFITQSSSVIQHGTINILRVPSGKIAKIWIGSEPYLLPSRKKAYVFDHALFKLVNNTNKDPFYDATSNLIEHGSIKYIMPKTTEKAIIHAGGQLDVIDPSKDKKPIIIDDETYKVSGFINTAVQTLVFPSDKHKEDELAKGKNKKAAITATYKGEHFKTFRTSDSLLVGVKLLVAYQVFDVKKALTDLKSEEDIIKFIKKTATTDIGRAIQKCSSQEFLSSKRNSPKQESPTDLLTHEEAPKTYHDEIKEALGKDLKKYGIELVRFNIEKAVIMDKKVADEMEQQAIRSAKTNATALNLRMDIANAEGTAKMDAKVKQTAQDQANQAIISKADAEAHAINQRGKAYRENPEVLQLEIIQAIAKPLAKANLNVTSKEFANLLSSPAAFFSLAGRSAVAQPNSNLEETLTANPKVLT